MCGIFGHTGASKAMLEKSHTALHSLTHRGPNGWKHDLADGVYMGHRRLSIIDLSENGLQPMVSQDDGDDVALTVNGEIYNFMDLRAELEEAHGVKFKSHSDSEVLLHGYRKWGMDALLARADGMFSLALHDRVRGKIFLARDHVGIKPMFYGFRDGELSWASELKAIVALYGKENLTVDNTAVYDFLTYLYIPVPKTLYKDVFKLPPAHLLTFDVAGKTYDIKPYWHLGQEEDAVAPYATFEDAKAGVRDAIGTSVKDQLVADVPVGFFLSGGIDSSVVCLEARPHVKEMLTFSIGFDDPAVDETPFAKAVADQLKTKHTAREVDHATVQANARLLRDLFDEPFGDTSAFPTLEVSRLAAENVTVVLTGDGGDELFGGYSKYTRKMLMLTPWTGFLAPLRPLLSWAKNGGGHRVPVLNKLTRMLGRLEFFGLNDPVEKYVKMSGGMLRTDARKKVWRAKLGIVANYDDYWYLRPFYRADLPLKTRAQYLDFHTYMHDLVLTKVDRTSMYCAIETRVPLLSRKTIAAAWAVPEDWRYTGGMLKGILKEVYRGLLPDQTLFRRKQGFSLGRTKDGDMLHQNGQTLPEVILERWFPELGKPTVVAISEPSPVARRASA